MGKRGVVEHVVDNFFAEIFFNDFNAQPAKSCKSTIFIDFRFKHALFSAQQGRVSKQPYKR